MPDYQKILELEKRVNEHPLPSKYDPVGLLSQSGASPNAFNNDTDQEGDNAVLDGRTVVLFA